MIFETLFAQIYELEETQRYRGIYFEYLVRAYLKNEPTYKMNLPKIEVEV